MSEEQLGDSIRWNLDPIYTGFDSPEYLRDRDSLSNQIVQLRDHLDSTEANSPGDLNKWLYQTVRQLNSLYDLIGNLQGFAYASYSTNTKDHQGMQEIGRLEELLIPFHTALVRFRNYLGSKEIELEEALEQDDNLRKYRFFIREEMQLQKRQMSEAEEELASDLSRSGGNAWSKMQEAVSSTISLVWDGASGEKKTINELRALAYDPDRDVRKKAYELEIEGWRNNEIPLAFALNGVKGFSVALNKRRGYKNTLERSTFQSRIESETLESMIGVMEDSLPHFRRYLKNKGKLMGIGTPRFYDIFAPVAKEHKLWEIDQAKSFIIEQFGSFSRKLGDFAAAAFDQQWIDAEIREGKVGGAYCVSFPLKQQSRILCNYAGNFGDVTTIAHELGHAYHHHILKDAPGLHRDYPMTLAETASIFSETLILEEVLTAVSGDDKVALLEESLQNATQVIVDILSRFYFEQEVFARRAKSELSPADFCEMMIDAQKKTYGDGLDETVLHPYMWAVKSHYYSQDFGYYNFPYAFGLLFGTGLYTLFKQEGASFVPKYDAILSETGRKSAEDVTAMAGFDIRTRDFWEQGIAAIVSRIDTYESMIQGGTE